MSERLVDEIRGRLRGERRLTADTRLDLDFADGVLTIEAEVDSVAVKRRLLVLGASHPAVVGIVDRLRVKPARAMGDGDVRDHVRRALVEELTFAELAIDGAGSPVSRAPAGRAAGAGEIGVGVADGVVTLAGTVPSLAHKRLAGVLAWWVPGTRDVVNDLDVAPPEADSDDEITDAVRLAIEKDPFVNSDAVGVATRDSVVTLTGMVPKDAEREMAELDAWYVFGVDDVRNEIVVHCGPVAGVAPEARGTPGRLGGPWHPRGTSSS